MNEYFSVTERLHRLETTGIKLGLDQIRSLLASLGNPQDSYPSILIAGTNGKGSVSAMLEAVLRLHDYRTAHYTSPHLMDVRERIRIHGEMISEDEFTQVLRRVFEQIDLLVSSSRMETAPTYFETITAAAFLFFQQRHVDIAVVEVGLGGRFDATNALQQILSIIPSIDFDHEEFLGKSLSEIAFEKAGIFKQGVPAVAGMVLPEALQVLRSVAKEKDCLFMESDPASVNGLKLQDGFPIFEYTPWNLRLRVNLRGRHQAANVAVVLQACDQLRELGFNLHNRTICEALDTVKWPGRLDVIWEDPFTLVDCAHNPMGVRSLAQFADDMHWSRVIALFTAMSDKKIVPMMNAISSKIETIFLTRVPPFVRCATLDQLANTARDAGLRFELEEDARSALKRARNAAGQAGLPLLIFGSIYLIGEVLKATTGQERIEDRG